MSFLFSWCSTGGLGAHSAVWWLSLLHLISIFSGPQLIRAPGPFGLVWLSQPQLVSTGTRTLWPELNCFNCPCHCQLPQLPSWLCYIIVQRVHDHPLDLWNWMFNRHQGEITVMQFRGHSLLVRQSMRVLWDIFTSSHFISQFPPMWFPLPTAIGMCHFLPVHHLEWQLLAGSKGQNITPEYQ